MNIFSCAAHIYGRKSVPFAVRSHRTRPGAAICGVDRWLPESRNLLNTPGWKLLSLQPCHAINSRRIVSRMTLARMTKMTRRYVIFRCRCIVRDGVPLQPSEREYLRVNRGRRRIHLHRSRRFRIYIYRKNRSIFVECRTDWRVPFPPFCSSVREKLKTMVQTDKLLHCKFCLP